MTTHGETPPLSGSNGRKVALIVVAIAFIASATTAMLAFTASHRAREADAKAFAADSTDLHGMLADWQAALRLGQAPSGGGLEPPQGGHGAAATPVTGWA